MVPSLSGFVPIRISPRQGGVRVWWCWLGDGRLDEPFFLQTVERLLRDPFNLVFAPETDGGPLEALVDPGTVPSGLVLHTSRCGSTLVARMLAAREDHRILSEPEPLEGVLRLPGTFAAADRRRAWLRGLASAWAPAGGGRLFVKLDAISTLSLPELRQVFPGVPRVFLYRDAVEVLASNLEEGSLRDGNLVLAARCGTHVGGGDADFAARVLARILEAAVADSREGGTLLVRYDELPGAFVTRIAPHLGVVLSPEDEAAARRVSLEDAKAPGRPFRTAAARSVVAPQVRAAAERHLRQPFSELEAARARQLARGTE